MAIELLYWEKSGPKNIKLPLGLEPGNSWIQSRDAIQYDTEKQ